MLKITRSRSRREEKVIGYSKFSCSSHYGPRSYLETTAKEKYKDSVELSNQAFWLKLKQGFNFRRDDSYD